MGRPIKLANEPAAVGQEAASGRKVEIALLVGGGLSKWMFSRSIRYSGCDLELTAEARATVFPNLRPTKPAVARQR